MNLIRKWITSKSNSGEILLNFHPDRPHRMSRNRLGDFYEQLAVEILYELGFSLVSRVNTFYDIIAQKNSKNYYIEVKGRASMETPYVSTQLSKLSELAKTKDVYWLFITLETEKEKVFAKYSFEPFKA